MMNGEMRLDVHEVETEACIGSVFSGSWLGQHSIAWHRMAGFRALRALRSIKIGRPAALSIR